MGSQVGYEHEPSLRAMQKEQRLGAAVQPILVVGRTQVTGHQGLLL